jgi:hypothetical protein
MVNEYKDIPNDVAGLLDELGEKSTKNALLFGNGGSQSRCFLKTLIPAVDPGWKFQLLFFSFGLV